MSWRYVSIIFRDGSLQTIFNQTGVSESRWARPVDTGIHPTICRVQHEVHFTSRVRRTYAKGTHFLFHFEYCIEPRFALPRAILRKPGAGSRGLWDRDLDAGEPGN